MTALEIHLEVNGRPMSLTEATLLAALRQAGFADRKGLAAAVNGRVVPRGEWAGTAVAEGDQVLVVQATQGGR